MVVGRGNGVAQILGHGHGGMFCAKAYTVTLNKLATRVELQNVLAGKLVWLQKLYLILHVATAEILQSNQCAEHLTI